MEHDNNLRRDYSYVKKKILCLLNYILYENQQVYICMSMNVTFQVFIMIHGTS